MRKLFVATVVAEKDSEPNLEISTTVCLSANEAEARGLALTYFENEHTEDCWRYLAIRAFALKDGLIEAYIAEREVAQQITSAAPE